MVKRDFYVQTGRVAVINYGENAGKWVTILDIVDGSRVLVDGPTSGVSRQIVPIKHLAITGIKYRVPRTATSITLKKFIVGSGVTAKVEKNSWVAKAKRQQIRANLTDFERFKVAYLKKQRKIALQ